MKIQRILLINPSVDSAEGRENWSKVSSMQPHGLCSIKSYLCMHGYEVKVVDMLVGAYRPQELRDLVETYQPHLVGMSTYTQCADTVYAICRFLKKLDERIITVLGGPHVTLLPEEALLREQTVDYVAMGEGEATLIELLESLNTGGIALSEIQGLVYREEQYYGPDQRIKINPPRSRVQGLDILPFSNNDDLPLDAYAAPYTIISSRGCPGQCIFCAAGALSGAQQRGRSAENIFSEVYHLYVTKAPSYFLVTDDTFTVFHRRLKRFCHLMIDSGIRLDWWCESRVQGITRKLMELMVAAGCVSIQFGVESGSQEVLDKIRKYMSLEKLHEILQQAYELGIRPVCSMILGHYCDTAETMQETVELARTLKDKYDAAVLVSINTLFPGTYQYEHREELGLHLYSENWRDFDLGKINIYTNNFDRETLADFYFRITPYISSRIAEDVFRKSRRQPQEGEARG